MEILKKTTHLNRISAAMILALGLWVGLAGQCFADTTYTIINNSDTTINPLNPPNSQNLVADSNGNLYVAYEKTVSSYMQIFVASSTDNGATWNETQITSGNYNQLQVALAIDRNDNLYVVWIGDNASSSGKLRIRFKEKVNGTWSAITDLTTDNYDKQFPSISIDSNNNIHVAWDGLLSADNSYQQIQYIKRTSGTWGSVQTLTSTAANAYQEQQNPVLIVDNNDVPHIFWHGRYSGSTTYYHIRHIYNDGSWSSIENVTNDISGSTQYYPNVSIDSNNYIHLVYEDKVGTSYYQIKYRLYNGSWSAVSTIASSASYNQEYPIISIDGTDTLSVIWQGIIDGGDIYKDVIYASYSGSWSSPVTLADDSNYNLWLPNLIYNPVDGYSYVYSTSQGYIKYSLSADFDPPSYYKPSEISITYPTSSSTSKAEYWTVDANTNDDTTYDKLYVKVQSASTEACAENTACTSAWVDGNKVIGECDGVDSTFDNTSNVSRLANIPDSMDGETIYATAYLYGVTDATCVDGEGPEVPVLLATSPTISFTYSIDYITDLDNADEYWAGTWADRWGAATSTASYQAVAGGFDLVMGPVVNWASSWSHLFNTADATDAGISAGSGIQTLMQHTKDFFNVIPGCQLFAIILIAIIIDIAIYIYKNIYRIKKFFTV